MLVDGKQLAAVLRIKALRRLHCCALAVCGFGEGRGLRRRSMKSSRSSASHPGHCTSELGFKVLQADRLAKARLIETILELLHHRAASKSAQQWAGLPIRRPINVAFAFRDGSHLADRRFRSKKRTFRPHRLAC